MIEIAICLVFSGVMNVSKLPFPAIEYIFLIWCGNWSRIFFTLHLALKTYTTLLISYQMHIECFRFKCCKTETKVIAMANKEKGRYFEPMKTQSKTVSGV